MCSGKVHDAAKHWKDAKESLLAVRA